VTGVIKDSAVSLRLRKLLPLCQWDRWIRFRGLVETALPQFQLLLQSHWDRRSRSFQMIFLNFAANSKPYSKRLLSYFSKYKIIGSGSVQKIYGSGSRGPKNPQIRNTGHHIRFQCGSGSTALIKGKSFFSSYRKDKICLCPSRMILQTRFPRLHF
jgi:hypothetical protein